MCNLFLVYFFNIYMFQAYLGPSSGGTTICIQQLVLIILFRWLSSWLHWIVYIQLYLLMIGLDMPKTCSGWQNILRISCASSWIFLHTVAQFSIPSRLVLYIYCILGTVWGCELVCVVCSKCETVCSVHCLCCVVLCAVNVRQCVVCTVCVVLSCVMRECYRVACYIFSRLSAVQ